MLKEFIVMEVDMALSFTAHGNSHIWVQNNIIVIESRGPWNLEYFQGFHQDLINVVKHHALVNYGVLYQFD